MMHTRVAGHQVTIGTTPTGFGGANLYVGAFVGHGFHDNRYKGHWNDVLVAPTLGQLLTGLTRIARQR